MTGLIMWAVYDHPTDFPAEYVARRFLVDSDGPLPTSQVLTSNDLDCLRDALQDMGLVCLTRSEGDDPKIVETWL
jgi:hypothetical protein